MYSVEVALGYIDTRSLGIRSHHQLLLCILCRFSNLNILLFQTSSTLLRWFVGPLPILLGVFFRVFSFYLSYILSTTSIAIGLTRIFVTVQVTFKITTSFTPDVLLQPAQFSNQNHQNNFYIYLVIFSIILAIPIILSYCSNYQHTGGNTHQCLSKHDPSLPQA